MKPLERDQAARALSDWFVQVARPLPWREGYQPYQVWLSEIMAQQTRMETVVPYFQRFVEELPDIQSLAHVEEERLLKLWEGLGYYSRARNLSKAAQQILQQHQGTLPSNRADLLALPGIGPYTAGAILAIAYNQPEPLVDGNIERVVSRWRDMEENVKSKAGHQKISETLVSLMPHGEPRILAQSLMELGASLCRPRKPDCAPCPLAQVCLAKTNQTWESRPVLPARKKTIKQQKNLLLFEHQGRLYVEQQPTGALWAQMWLFPLVKSSSPQEGPTGLGPLSVGASWERLGGFRYSVTCYQVQTTVWLAHLTQQPSWLGQWKTPETLATLGLPRPAVKALAIYHHT